MHSALPQGQTRGHISLGGGTGPRGHRQQSRRMHLQDHPLSLMLHVCGYL